MPSSSQPPPPSPNRKSPPVDILGEAVARGRFRRSDLAEVLTRWLEKQLLEDQYARLEQAGHSPEGRIPLARVFVDIEAPRIEGHPWAPWPGPTAIASGFVHEMLGVEPVAIRLPQDKAESGHYLLIGSPGQGKSTLGRYLCQIHRAALLEPRASSLSVEGQVALEAVQQHVAQDGLQIRSRTCFPLRIELGGLSAWMRQAGPADAVLKFLVEQLRTRVREDVAVDDMREFCGKIPLLLVLDDLDEASVSAGRGAVLAAVDTFRRDLAALGAQGIVIAAARPYGDGSGFSDFELRYIAPLTKALALRYAERLVTARYGDQPGRKKTILGRFELACDDIRSINFMQTCSQVADTVAFLDRRYADPSLAPRPGPVHLESIHLENLRAFRALSIPLVPPSNAQGQWLVLLGDNGMGKSTILRALVFALAEPDIIASLLAGATALFRRDDSISGFATVTLGGVVFRTDLVAESSRESARFFPSDAVRPLIFAYGCRRGSALGGADKEVAFTPRGEIITLFEESEGLIHAETWLRRLKLGSLLNPGGKQENVFNAVISLLTKILPGVDSIDVREDGAWFTGPSVGRARLAALSDGYVTTIGWVLDMIARWLERADRMGISVEADFNLKMEGLVLVDELDLHLHPRWQRHVIQDLRALFPRLSFVVTTHNPLTLLGARDGEIFVLRRPGGENDEIEVRQINLPLGTRADQILTGPWFDLLSTLDDDTLAHLEQHRQMLRDGVPGSDPNRRDLEDLLRRRLGTFAENAVERLALSVAAELLDEMHQSYQDLTPDQRDELRTKLRERLAARRGQGPTPAK
jgi:hypothetical protein